MKLFILFTKLVERVTDSENNQGFFWRLGGFTGCEKSVCAAWLMTQVGSPTRKNAFQFAEHIGESFTVLHEADKTDGQRWILFISFGHSHGIWKGLV